MVIITIKLLGNQPVLSCARGLRLLVAVVELLLSPGCFLEKEAGFWSTAEAPVLN